MNGEKAGLVIIGLPSAKDAEYALWIQHGSLNIYADGRDGVRCAPVVNEGALPALQRNYE